MSSSCLYEQDFPRRAGEQAGMLRSGRLSADIEGIAEESDADNETGLAERPFPHASLWSFALWPDE